MRLRPRVPAPRRLLFPDGCADQPLSGMVDLGAPAEQIGGRETQVPQGALYRSGQIRHLALDRQPRRADPFHTQTVVRPGARDGCSL